jgi:hypothetical protein
MMVACSDSSDAVMNGMGGAGWGGMGGAVGMAGSDAAGGGGTAGDSGAAGVRGALDAGARCNDVVNTAPAVTATYPDAAFPVAAGGPVLDGTYHMTRLAIYPGGTPEPAGTTHRETDVITHTSPTTIAVQTVVARNSEPDARFNFSAELSGSSLLLTRTCPPADPFPESYTATGNDFSILIESASVVNTTTKQ